MLPAMIGVCNNGLINGEGYLSTLFFLLYLSLVYISQRSSVFLLATIKSLIIFYQSFLPSQYVYCVSMIRFEGSTKK